jgi:hypothetical protein
LSKAGRSWVEVELALAVEERNGIAKGGVALALSSCIKVCGNAQPFALQSML